MATYRVKAYDLAGVRIKDETVESSDGPAFLAHQLLHADAVEEVEVYDQPSGDLILRRQHEVVDR